MARRSGMGAWSMAIGVVAFIIAIVSSGVGFIPNIGFCSWCFEPFGLICAISAIVLGVITLIIGQRKEKGKAVVGLIFGVLYFFVMLVLFIISRILHFAFKGV